MYSDDFCCNDASSNIFGYSIINTEECLTIDKLASNRHQNMPQANGFNGTVSLDQFYSGEAGKSDEQVNKIKETKKDTKNILFKTQEEKIISNNKNLFIVCKENITENCLKVPKNETENNEEKEDNSKTKNSSKENEQNSPTIVPFKIHKIQKRIDYAKNKFKKHLSKYLTKKANDLIQNSDLPLSYKQKIFLPNHKSFTGNPKEKDNSKFLSFTIENVFGYYKEGIKNCKLQKKNKTSIEAIINFVEWSQNIQQYEEIITFFKMELREGIELFYKSKDFQEYANDPITKLLDEEFKRQKNFSLLETNGFIKMVELFKKN